MIDDSRLLSPMLFDSGVVIRALEYDKPPHTTDPRSIACRQLWEAALRKGLDIFIAAPTVFEFHAKRTAKPIPASKSVRVVAVTEPVIHSMLQWADSQVIKDIQGSTGLPRVVVSFDALIVACAKAHRAKCIVSLDDDVHKLAAKAGLPCHAPTYFTVTVQAQASAPTTAQAQVPTPTSPSQSQQKSRGKPVPPGQQDIFALIAKAAPTTETEAESTGATPKREEAPEDAESAPAPVAGNLAADGASTVIPAIDSGTSPAPTAESSLTSAASADAIGAATVREAPEIRSDLPIEEETSAGAEQN